ncbi:hypothetical protein L1049_024091 [Liquidambar formosana]|uniref:Cation-transporting P-type ATPase C-terminal domain-containing protein n=1 Tax=Liquidambar formosana TaxID=63359 RepID=A0AAP0RUB8_LIQFO
MNSNHAIPQNLSACATTGLVDVLCTDTTGGLMCHQMEVNKFFIGEKDIEDDENFEPSELVLESLSRGIGVPVLVSEIPVSPTDNLLISWAKSRWGVNREFPEQSYEVLDHKKLCSNKKCRGVLMRKNGDDEKILHLHWKGAASTILGMCSHYYDCGGRTYAMGNKKCKFEKVIKDMEDGCLRPIAYAYKQTEIQELGEDGLNLLAIVGFKYTCQEEAKSAVEALRNAGISIKFVSGDELPVVRAIACGFGILSPGSNDVVLEGREFRRLNSTVRKEMVGKITVMGSSQPEDIVLMVQCLKQIGHVVAFRGGTTTSDTASLKEADIGITEKTQSTEMARESCDFVISDISSLTPIFKFGRCVYLNIQTFVQLQLTALISGLLITFITTVFLGESPITAIQLIWINLITWILGGAMLVMEPPNQDQMINQPGARRSESLVTKSMWRNIITQLLYQAVVLLVFHFKGQAIPGMNPKERKALIFNSFTLCQVFNQFNAMDLVKKEVLSKVVLQKYYCFLVAVGAIAVMQFLVVEFAGSLANGMRLNWVQWAFCAIIAALSCGFDRAVKSISNSSRSVGSRIRFSRWMPSSCASLWLFPCSMFLLFSLSYYFNPGTALSLR